MADNDDLGISQDEIDAMLKGAGPANDPPAKPKSPPPPPEDDDGGPLGQDEIEALLQQNNVTAPAPTPQNSGASKAAASSGGSEAITQGDIEFLLAQAEQALASVDKPVESEADVHPFRLEEFTGAPASTDAATLELIRDVELDLKIELGRTQMYLEDVLKLRKGSVVALDKLAGDPVDIYVNGRLVARGEILVLNDNFCVRVAELIAGVSAQAG